MRATIAVINKACIRRNTQKIKKLIKDTDLIVMVKADGYGHGIIQSAQAVIEGGADALGVAIVEEGLTLRNGGINERIISVGAMLEQEDAEQSVEYDIEQTVFNEDTVSLLAAAARKYGKTAKVHIKVETGMNRLGVKRDNIDALLSAIAKTNGAVTVAGVFTHFAASDSDDKRFTYEQNAIFAECVAKVKAKYPAAKAHASCSGAIIDCPDLRYDMVRAGIIAYGYYPSNKVKKLLDLEPAFSLKTVVTNIKTIDLGQSVSYGRTFVASRETVVATLPIGYGDGYRFALSNKGIVLINGLRAPVIGRVCMDQMMIDITDCGTVCLGQEVVLLGRQGSDAIWADEMARWANTISYEIMLSISQRVAREYIDA